MSHNIQQWGKPFARNFIEVNARIIPPTADQPLADVRYLDRDSDHTKNLAMGDISALCSFSFWNLNKLPCTKASKSVFVVL